MEVVVMIVRRQGGAVAEARTEEVRTVSDDGVGLHMADMGKLAAVAACTTAVVLVRGPVEEQIPTVGRTA